MNAPRPFVRRALGPAFACALAAPGAFAAGPGVGAVEVRRAGGADDCPGAEAFVERVERQLGRHALVPGPAPNVATAFEVWLSGEGRLRRARLLSRGRNAGERTLVDRDKGCEGLVEAVAATIAIALSDGAPEEALSSRDAPADHSFGMSVEAGLDATTGVLGSFVPAGRALFEIRPLPWLGLGVGALATPSKRFDRAPGSADISLLGAELRACGGPSRLRPLGFALCASWLVGAMRASGRGYAPNRETTGRLAALAAGPRLEGGLYGPLTWTAHASALVPLWSDRFTVDSLGVVYDPPAIGALIGGGLSLTIW